MNKSIFLALSAAAVLLFAPLHAGAVTTQARTVEYETTYTLAFPLSEPGEYLGRMTLYFTPAGEVSGLYRDEYDGGYTHVAGGLKGTAIWLTIGGPAVTRQINGTLHEDGTITGSFSHFADMHAYKFTAVPVKR